MRATTINLTSHHFKSLFFLLALLFLIQPAFADDVLIGSHVPNQFGIPGTMVLSDANGALWTKEISPSSFPYSDDYVLTESHTFSDVDLINGDSLSMTGSSSPCICSGMSASSDISIRMDVYMRKQDVTYKDMYGDWVTSTVYYFRFDFYEVESSLETESTGTICINTLDDLYDDAGVPYYVEVTPVFDSSRSDYEYYYDPGYSSSGDRFLLFDEDTIDFYMHSSGTASLSFSYYQIASAGNYTATLYERCLISGEPFEFILDSCSFTVLDSSSSGDDDIGDGFDDLPDDFEDYVDDGWEPGDLVDDGDYTNTTILAPYYSMVYSVINGFHTTVSSFIHWLLTPVRLIIGYLGSAVNIGISVINNVSGYIAPVGIMLSAFFGVVPDIFIHIGSLGLFFVLYLQLTTKGEI